MNICMVVPVPPPYGGIANWTKMIKEYAQSREDVTFSFVNTAPAKRGMEGRTLWDRVVVQGFDMLRLDRELRKLLKEKKHDAVHMTTSGQLAIIRDILMLKTAKKMGVPSVYHLRFGRIPEIAQRNTLEWKMLKKAMEIADCVMAIDSASHKAIKKYASGVNVCYVPNPFDMKKLEGVDINHAETKKEVVFVGWVIKTKGVEELLCAWRNTEKKHPDWTLKIVGPYSPEYKMKLENDYPCQRCVFEGEKSNKEALDIVSQGSVFILPSYTEGFPNAVLEAMALEKAIVATSVGAIPDMIDGCGIVIEPMNAAAIELALDEMLGDEAQRLELSQKAKQKMLDEYTMEKVFEVYKSVWGKL